MPRRPPQYLCGLAPRADRPQGTALRTASASRVAVGLPLPRQTQPAPVPAHAGSDAWPGERVSPEPGNLGSSSHLALARSTTARASCVSSDRSWSSNDSMCGSDEGCCSSGCGEASASET